MEKEKEKAHRGRSGAILDIYIGIISGFIGVSLLLSKLTTMWGLIDEPSSSTGKMRFLMNLEGTSWGYIIGAFSTLYAIFRFYQLYKVMKSKGGWSSTYKK